MPEQDTAIPPHVPPPVGEDHKTILTGYNIDAIEAELRVTFAEWGVHADIEQFPDRLEVYEPGILPREYNSIAVDVYGNCAIHWSIPRGISIESIVKKHTITERVNR